METDEFRSPHRTTVGSRVVASFIVLFAVIAILIACDIVADFRSGTEPGMCSWKASLWLWRWPG